MEMMWKNRNEGFHEAKCATPRSLVCHLCGRETGGPSGYNLQPGKGRCNCWKQPEIDFLKINVDLNTFISTSDVVIRDHAGQVLGSAVVANSS